MKKIYFFFGSMLLLGMVNAQQLHFTSQYLQHNSMYNPAAAGMSDEKGSLGISYRSMWSAFPGNPKTMMIYGDMQLPKFKSGVGAYIYNDQTGPTKRTGLQVAYSYHVTTNDEKTKIGLGLELRGLQYAIDKTKLAEALGTSDPILSGSSNKIAIDAGAGIYVRHNNLSIGLAVSQLIQSKLKLATVVNSTETGKLYRHYIFTANYKWQTGEDIYLVPNAMVRVIEHSPTEFDFGCKLDFKNLFYWGFNYRVNQSWSGGVGIKVLKKLGIAYNYDNYNTPLSQFNAGSNANEIGIKFDF